MVLGNALGSGVIESGHGSTIEHVVFTFAISGVSRTLSHQLVRHRAGVAFDQQSQRYVKFKGAATMLPTTIAEGDATIGFAGPRVAERFTGTPLPPGSHTANYAYTHGLVDELVSPADAHAYVAAVLKVLAPDRPDGTESPPRLDDVPERDAWETVEAVRNPTRPLAVDLVRGAADMLIECGATLTEVTAEITIAWSSYVYWYQTPSFSKHSSRPT